MLDTELPSIQNDVIVRCCIFSCYDLQVLVVIWRGSQLSHPFCLLHAEESSKNIPDHTYITDKDSIVDLPWQIALTSKTFKFVIFVNCKKALQNKCLFNLIRFTLFLLFFLNKAPWIVPTLLLCLSTMVFSRVVLVMPISATRGRQLAGSPDSCRLVRTTTMRAVIQRVTKASVTGKWLFCLACQTKSTTGSVLQETPDCDVHAQVALSMLS